MAKSDCDKCPCCSQRVKVSTADEGTSCYIGTERDEGLEEAAKMLANLFGESETITASEIVSEIRAMKGER